MIIVRMLLHCAAAPCISQHCASLQTWHRGLSGCGRSSGRPNRSHAYLHFSLPQAPLTHTAIVHGDSQKLTGGPCTLHVHVLVLSRWGSMDQGNFRGRKHRATQAHPDPADTNGCNTSKSVLSQATLRWLLCRMYVLCRWRKRGKRKVLLWMRTILG